MWRREFITGLGSAVAWPVRARAQQPALPVIGLVYNGSADTSAAGLVPAFRKGLGETGYVEGRNVTVEYHGLEGQYDRLPALMEGLVRRRVVLIATPGATAIHRSARSPGPTEDGPRRKRKSAERFSQSPVRTRRPADQGSSGPST
jgi:putative tryptophan/tyrosine transport system substrate-binding protein